MHFDFELVLMIIEYVNIFEVKYYKYILMLSACLIPGTMEGKYQVVWYDGWRNELKTCSEPQVDHNKNAEHPWYILMASPRTAIISMSSLIWTVAEVRHPQDNGSRIGTSSTVGLPKIRRGSS